MEKFSLTIFSLKFNTIIELGYTEETSQIIFDFLSLFSVKINNEIQTISIDYKHQYTASLKEKINKYIDNYKNYLPQIQKINTYFGKLEKNEWFFTLPPIEFNTRERYKLEEELNSINGYSSNITEDEKKLFDCIMDNYEIKTFDLNRHGKIKIGESNKSKRVCRFCKESKPAINFTKEAHAISEAIGNKKLILNEECDECNEFFDKNIERDFFNFHRLSLTMHGIKGKDNKISKIKKDNTFEISKDKDSHEISIKHKEVKNFSIEPSQNLVFETGEKVKLQSLYKALCKFSLSVIESKYIEHFHDTMSWLKDQKQINSLPKVAILNSDGILAKEPEIALYIRKNDNTSVPYLVGQLKFSCHMYIFIVPFSNQDKLNFIEESEYNKFLNCFRQMANIRKFKYVDLSQNIERKLSLNIKFEKRKA